MGSMIEICRAHNLNNGTMHMGAEGIGVAILFSALALIYLAYCFHGYWNGDGMILDDDEYEDAQQEPMLENIYLAYGGLSAVGAVIGLLWPSGFGIFFYDGDTDSGLQHEAAHVIVRFLASLLAAQAWICWTVAYPCRRQDRHTVLTCSFAGSGSLIALVLTESHQRSDGTMSGWAGIVILVVQVLCAGGFFVYWKSFHSMSQSRSGMSSRGLASSNLGEGTPLCAATGTSEPKGQLASDSLGSEPKSLGSDTSPF